ncbi:hypothetical protein K2173_017275 [Erythroxylum novogranatense]|uniref:Uncharacterized protein n=1 Tax=Erythroxylum novogranatense TaxID=1862640 RepID=A0AAV8U9J9_9ROSI|nr:hypothetical protein K2173_017275 [Erythroxylum novogranatense]
MATVAPGVEDNIGERPWIPVTRSASRTSSPRPDGRRTLLPQVGGSKRAPPSAAQLGSRSHVPHPAVFRGVSIVIGGSRFNVLANVEQVSEDVTPPMAKSSPFIFSGSGKLMTVHSLVPKELPRIQAGSTVTKVNASTSTVHSKGKEIDPTTLNCVEPAPGGAMQASADNLISLQPTATTNHLALDIRSYTEMVCDQVLVPKQLPDSAKHSHLMEGVEAFRSGDRSGSEATLPPPTGPPDLSPEACLPTALPN